MHRFIQPGMAATAHLCPCTCVPVFVLTFSPNILSYPAVMIHAAHRLHQGGVLR